MRQEQCNNHRLVHHRGDPRSVREDMAGQLVTLLLILRVMAAVSDDLKPIEITIAKVPNGFSVTLDWENECLKEEREVTFSAVYKKLGAPDNESQTCEIDEECSCSIPSAGLDHSHNYTLLVTAKTPGGKTLSNSHNFDPNQETKSPPKFSVTASDALVIIAIKDHQHNEEYNVTLRRNDSAEETSVIIRLYPHIIPLNELLPEQTYCVKVSVYCIETMALSPFSPEECFTTPAPGLLSNLAMNALDLTYLLKWDWDFDQSPNATFSVEKCLSYNGCTKIKGCENITTPQCDCSGLNFIGKFILRVSVYDGQRKEKSASTIRFSAREDTNFRPPKELKMQIIENSLFINVTAPDGFRHTEIYNYCPWLTNLSYWINATHDPEVTFEEKKQPFFTIDSLKKSTTYCAKAKMACKNSNRSSLYSEVYCITTDPRSYTFAWIIGFTFLGIVLISVLLYFCFCPFKRYMKQIFFPSNKLPSSFEKGLGDPSLNCMKTPFLSHTEEATDRCYIVQNSFPEDLVQVNYNKTSQVNNQDSGNYSHEGQTTGEAFTQ